MRIWMRFLAQFPVIQLWSTLQLDVELNETHQEEVDTLKCHGHHMVCQIHTHTHKFLLVFCVFFCRYVWKAELRNCSWSSIYCVCRCWYRCTSWKEGWWAKVAPFMQAELQHAIRHYCRQSTSPTIVTINITIIFFFFFLRNIWLQLDAQISSRRDPVLEINLYCATVPCVFLVVVVLCVASCLKRCIKRNKRQAQLFPPVTGPWLPLLRRLLLPQVTENVCGTCFIVCSSTLLRMFGCQSRVRKARKLLPTNQRRRNILSLPYSNIHSCLFEQCAIRRIRKCEVSSLSGCDGMSSCSQCEMHAGKGCSSHQFGTR